MTDDKGLSEMSHGSTDKCEPNFTPLLDLVLQLVMFFMIVTNFVMEQTSEEVKLPSAVSAKALDKNTVDIIYLNVNSKGQVLLPPSEVAEGDPGTLDNARQVQTYMENKATIEKRVSKKEKPEATLILRIDEKTPFEKSYPIMMACRMAGYSNVQLRAIRAQGLEH
jgi:biopolymer transport protein ExbD